MAKRQPKANKADTTNPVESTDPRKSKRTVIRRSRLVAAGGDLPFDDQPLSMEELLGGQLHRQHVGPVSLTPKDEPLIITGGVQEAFAPPPPLVNKWIPRVTKELPLETPIVAAAVVPEGSEAQPVLEELQQPMAVEQPSGESIACSPPQRRRRLAFLADALTTTRQVVSRRITATRQRLRERRAATYERLDTRRGRISARTHCYREAAFGKLTGVVRPRAAAVGKAIENTVHDIGTWTVHTFVGGVSIIAQGGFEVVMKITEGCTWLLSYVLAVLVEGACSVADLVTLIKNKIVGAGRTYTEKKDDGGNAVVIMAS
jgi:hypothetical protein